MKTKLFFLSILLFIVTILLSRNNERISDTLLSAINPMKQIYKTVIQNIENKSNSYLFQKKSIEKLTSENRILRKHLLEQMHYIEEIKNIYDVLPELSHHPLQSTSIIETISYVKLNTFSQIILTKPKSLVKNRLYGLVQNRVAAGIAKVRNNQLYGYLTSDEKCRFAVFVGKSHAPGIAIGYSTNIMMVKFIPKWHQLHIGDKVVTSGLDNIFFANIPVGVVTKLEVQSAYTIAYIKTYNDVFHPKTFLLINNPRPTLTENFDTNHTQFIDQHRPNISSIPTTSVELPATPIQNTTTTDIDQTQEEPIEPEVIDENTTQKKIKKETN